MNNDTKHKLRKRLEDSDKLEKHIDSLQTTKIKLEELIDSQKTVEISMFSHPCGHETLLRASVSGLECFTPAEVHPILKEIINKITSKLDILQAQYENL